MTEYKTMDASRVLQVCSIISIIIIITSFSTSKSLSLTADTTP